MQLVEILSHSNKIKTVDDLLNHFDLIVELARDDVYRIVKAKKIFFVDFDFAYTDGVKLLRNQLTKTHLKAIKRFFKCDNIEKSLKWIISRIINNAINVSLNKKYKLYVAPQFCALHENIESNDDIDIILINDELMKFDKNTLKIGLKNIWEESIFDEDFDYEDLKYLCNRFKINISEISGNGVINMQKFKKEQVENGNSQLAFIFESEVA